MSEFQGRRVSLGVGIESTPGTTVAPGFWPRHMKLNFQRKTTTVTNDSAMGRVEKTNDSAVVEQWGEGDFEGKLYDTSGVAFLYNMFGTLVTTDNADTNPVVKDHTLDISQANVAKTVTIARTDPNTSRRHGYGTLENLEITSEQGGWVMLKGKLQATAGSTSSETVAYVAENSFTSKHVTVKVASNLAGLSGATALAIKNLRFTMSRDVAKFFAHGSIDPSKINVSSYVVEGEVTLQYDATTLEDLWYANTQRAMSISIVNTDVTIGASARPGIVFTMPQVRLNTFDMSDDLDAIVEQTVGFRAEINTTTGYLVRGVVTNTQASY